jgi:CubicO group peptidase (beta-lactamase class C family)
MGNPSDQINHSRSFGFGSKCLMIIIRLFFTTVLLFFIGCGDDTSSILSNGNDSFLQPEQIDDGWETSSLEEEGLDRESIDAVIHSINSNGYDFMESIVIAKNGKLVFEEYFNEGNRSSVFHIQSVTKSIASALIGIAFDHGLIDGVEDPIFLFFPEYDHLRDPEKDGITLKHVLTMTPGFEWNEVSTFVLDQDNDNVIGHRVNYIEYVLSKPVTHTPGTRWYYNSGCAILAGGIIRNTSGFQPEEFARQFLFDPLGINNWYWPGLPYTNNLTGTHGALYLTARALAKIGQVFLDGGTWDGNRIISKEWIDESTHSHVAIGGGMGYGYLWWSRSLAAKNLIYADGYGGQHIVIIPQEHLVIVTTASYEHLFEPNTNTYSQQDQIIWNIIASIIRAS